jgi:hypothetical protein
MTRYFDFVQSKTNGVITVTVLKRLYSNYLKNIEQTVSYKQRDVSTPIDCVRSKYVRNRLLVAGTPFVLKTSIKKVIGIETSTGDLISLRSKDIEVCDITDIPHLDVQRSEEMINM